MSDALRVLFAELGFDIDEAALASADAKVKAVAQSMTALVPVSDGVGQAVSAAAKVADQALGQVQRAAAGAVEAIETQFLDVEGLREAMAGARAEGMAAANSGPSVIVADDLKAEIAEIEKATEATRKLAEEEKKRREAPALRAQNERADHEAQAAFDGSDAGKAHAAWRRQVETTKAMQAPVQTLGAVTDRTQKTFANAFGRAMPASVQRFAEGMGVARGDTLSLGQVILDVSRRGSAGLAALAFGVTAFGVTAFVHSFAAESEALREAAREARVTSAELQALQHAGAQSGVGADRVTQSVTALGQKLRDANNHLPGSGGTVHMLRRLGISARDASGQIRPTVDILDDVAVAMEHVSSPRRRIRIAESLGLDRRMLEIMHTGAGGIRALREEMRELGGGVTPEATEAARRFTQQQERMRVALTSVRSSIFAQLAPTLTDLMQRGSRIVGWFARMTRGTHVFENAVRILGVALAAAAVPALVAWSPMIGMFLAAAAVVTVLSLAFDDLQNLLEGNNSLIGYLIDQYAGFGTAARWVRQIRDAWNEVGDAIARIGDAIDRWPPWARAAFDGATFGLRHLLPSERAGGSDSTAPPTDGPGAAPAPRRAPGRRGAGPAPVAPVQPMMPQANLAAWQAAQAGHAVNAPPVHMVPMPGGAPVVQQTTNHNAGDRNHFTINGNDPVMMRRELQRLLDERERRRNAQQAPRGTT